MTTAVSLVVALVGLVVMALAPLRNASQGRLIYWTGAVIACAASYFVAAPQGWKSGIGAAAFVLGATTFIAYAYTPFLKFKGRRISFYSDRAQPYGAAVTTTRSWWRTLIAMGIVVFGTVSYMTRGGPAWLAVGAAVVVVLTGAIFGYRDATLDAGIASGQRLQLVLASLVTAGVFTIAYFCGYYVSRRRAATRRDGQHSR
jgi:hypothetical protein